MKKKKIALCLLIIWMIDGDVLGARKNPFQPMNLQLCSVFKQELEKWQLKGVLISASGRQAMIIHPVLGIKKVVVGAGFPQREAEVTAIELTKITIRLSPLCPEKVMTIRFGGAP